jgi:hypothetical protein
MGLKKKNRVVSSSLSQLLGLAEAKEELIEAEESTSIQ